jgi:hypothetical protein
VRAAVVGHVEWIEFGRVDHVRTPGEIVHVSESWQEPAGGGAVAAMQLCKLAGAATLYTALGDDEVGHRAKRDLEALNGRTAEAPTLSMALDPVLAQLDHLLEEAVSKYPADGGACGLVGSRRSHLATDARC